jgi:putative copper export protein
MGAIFQSLGRTIIAGLVVLVVIIVVASGVYGGGAANAGDHAWWAFVFRWLHVMSGVMWIGLLWYFNFVQTPSMPKFRTNRNPR